MQTLTRKEEQIMQAAAVMYHFLTDSISAFINSTKNAITG